MQAIILAAGMGKRLGKLTYSNTKCMIEVNGMTLIERALTQLTAFKLNRIIIVIGFQGDNLRKKVGMQYNNTKIEYIENQLFAQTNNIYSLYLAKEKLEEDDTILLESDLIFEKSVLERIVLNSNPNVVLVDKYQNWMDGTVVTIKNDQILNFISKKAFDYNDIDLYYKTVNIYKFSKEFSNSFYIPFLEAYIKSFGNNEYYEQVLSVLTLIDHTELKAQILNGETWYEIDDLQDLDIASILFADPQTKLSKYQSRFGGYWRFPFLLDFCYLVNPYFPSKKLKNEIKSNFDNLLSQYPSSQSINALLASKCFGVSAKYLCVGNGAAELISILINNLDGKMGIVYPTFEEYPNRKSINQILKYVPKNNNFSYNASDLIHFFDKKNLSILLLINPDNPSGNIITYEDLIVLLEWARKENIFFILDESFIDFSFNSSDNSLLKDEWLEKYLNLIIIKSISKSYGIPGLRLGILATGNEIIFDKVKSNLSIWNINSFAEYYMQIYNKYADEYKKACLCLINERARFYSELLNIKYLRVIPSQSNYFLCEVISNYKSDELSLLLLINANILIKDCKRKKGFEEKEYVRIAIKSSEENNQLIHALKLLEEKCK